jgi:hypothetical protein
MLYNTFHSSSLFLWTASCWHTIYLLCATLFMVHSLVIHFIYIFFPVHSLDLHFLLAILCIFFVVHSLVPHFIYLLCGSFRLTLDPHFNYLLCSSCSLCSILSIFLAVHFLALHSIYLLCSSFSSPPFFYNHISSALMIC